MEMEGIDAKGDTPSKRVMYLLVLLKTLKVFNEGFCIINVGIAHVCFSFRCTHNYIVGSFSLKYDQKHLGFLTRLFPMTLLI